MPAPYASLGIFGGLLLLGVLVYSIWTQTPTPQREDKSHHNFNPGAGYDRPRNADWKNEDNPGCSRRRRRRSRAEPCAICRETLEGTHGNRCLPCGHSFHDNCILLWFREQQPPTCPNCRSPA